MKTYSIKPVMAGVVLAALMAGPSFAQDGNEQSTLR